MQRVSQGNVALPQKPSMLKVRGNAKARVRRQADRLSAEHYAQQVIQGKEQRK